MVKALFEQAVQKESSEQEQAEQLKTQTLERMSIELDGIVARLRRGSVPMEEKEQKRKGDVYREIKVGAVFRAERGRERSELAPDVWVDTAQVGSLRYVARRTAKGGFGPLLYCLASQCGLREAQQVVEMARWGALDLEAGFRTVKRGGADCRSLPCPTTCLGSRPCRLWTRQPAGH